ncbi:hypothetical protein [endosymbiont GvMRE of Glomus versiforme]|uniref:hypothetical protein n=1 Tax=endosymbiont GvMRE of Glomus versiforme TaxID=2039283 RepID=UPI000EC40529|nr:hypothetical protein [endosymbiont GvMRE of Glomus versiforme]RHZ36023.1 hypothetical protein GvMRE_Ic3g72 [endosymbiont GvMRE of Glomus versiforme]
MNDYQEFKDYFKDVKKMYKEHYEFIAQNKDIWKSKLRLFFEVNKMLERRNLEPVKLNEVLARRQFYRNNNLPGEVNGIIENYVNGKYDYDSNDFRFYERAYQNINSAVWNEDTINFQWSQLEIFLEPEKQRKLIKLVRERERESKLLEYLEQNNQILELKNQLRETNQETQDLEDQIILIQQIAEQEIEELSQKLAKEKIITDSYREVKNTTQQQNKQDQINFLNALKKLKLTNEQIRNELLTSGKQKAQEEKEKQSMLYKELIDQKQNLQSQENQLTNLKNKNKKKTKVIKKLRKEKKNWQQHEQELLTKLDKQQQKEQELQSKLSDIESKCDGLNQEKEALLVKQKELLAEIERLKTPPIIANKEKVLKDKPEEIKNLVEKVPLEQEQIEAISTAWQQKEKQFSQERASIQQQLKSNEKQLEVSQTQQNQLTKNKNYWIIATFSLSFILLFGLTIFAYYLLKRREENKRNSKTNIF